MTSVTSPNAEVHAESKFQNGKWYIVVECGDYLQITNHKSMPSDDDLAEAKRKAVLSLIRRQEKQNNESKTNRQDGFRSVRGQRSACVLC